MWLSACPIANLTRLSAFCFSCASFSCSKVCPRTQRTSQNDQRPSQSTQRTNNNEQQPGRTTARPAQLTNAPKRTKGPSMLRQTSAPTPEAAIKGKNNFFHVPSHP